MAAACCGILLRAASRARQVLRVVLLQKLGQGALAGIVQIQLALVGCTGGGVIASQAPARWSAGPLSRADSWVSFCASEMVTCFWSAVP